jgi:hypothetical protein
MGRGIKSKGLCKRPVIKQTEMEGGVFLEEMEEEIDVVETVVAEIEAAERAERV